MKKLSNKRKSLSPKRVQRKRTKGFKLPPNTVCVTRPGKWGNPFRVVRVGKKPFAWVVQNATHDYAAFSDKAWAVEWSLELFEMSIELRHAEIRRELRGKNLACYCPIGKPCHADVLLRIANRPAKGSK